MTTFQDFGLHDALTASLAKMDYAIPTPIQKQAIPIALDGQDIMGSAQTGTGKTAAFAIPLVQRLLTNPEGTALVLTPTRELGKQIMDIMHQLLGHKSKIKTAFIIGGEAYHKQNLQLKAKPRLIVGTPGRINDHLEQGNIDLSQANFLVLDETDRMLDMGFTVQIERIFKYMPAQRQTLMFSATMPKDILRMAQKYLNHPKRISIGETNVIAPKIKQEMMRIEQPKKYDELISQLKEREGSVIVFIKTKHGADKMAKNLRRDGFTSEALHGDLRQNKRDKVMQNFRKMNYRVLIATDIAARGLDVPHIEHVINYDLPQVAEDFIHRMGRTARAGAEGSAISFVASHDGRMWNMIAKLLKLDTANDSQSDDATKKGSRNQKRRSSSGVKSGFKKKFENNREKTGNNVEKKPFKQEKRKSRFGEKSGDTKTKADNRNKFDGKNKDNENRSKSPNKPKFSKPKSKNGLNGKPSLGQGDKRNDNNGNNNKNEGKKNLSGQKRVFKAKKKAA